VRKEGLCIVPIQCPFALHQVRLIKMCLIEIYGTVRELGQHGWYGEQTGMNTLGFSAWWGDTFFFSQNIQTSCGSRPASCAVVLQSKMARMWGRPHTCGWAVPVLSLYAFVVCTGTAVALTFIVKPTKANTSLGRSLFRVVCNKWMVYHHWFPPCL
jgi:hypothetical protein